MYVMDWDPIQGIILPRTQVSQDRPQINRDLYQDKTLIDNEKNFIYTSVT